MKKWLALGLVLCLCLSLLSVTPANAANDNEVSIICLEELAYPITGRNPDYEIRIQDHMEYCVDTGVNGEGWYNGIKWCHAASVDPLTPEDSFGYGLYLVFICIALEEGCYYAPEDELFAWHIYGVEGDCSFGTVAPVEDKLVVTYSFEARDDSYSVTVDCEENGSVSGSGTYYYGDTVTIEAKPNMGYALDHWQFEGDRPAAYSNPYSFTVTEDTHVTAIFTPAPFEDICGTDYYFKPIYWAVDEGITTGTSETTFSPGDSCTRAQAVTFLWRYEGCPQATRSPGFADVAPDAYYYDAVAWAVEQGITTGTADYYFSPDETCTRAQIVTFLWRLENQYDYGNTYMPFADVPADAYYYDAVRFALAADITTGTSETSFSPEDVCTRGQIVTFLWRCFAKG